MSEIHQTWHFDASPDEVFNALVDQKLVEEWTGDKAEVSDEVGATFSLWGGEITGKNLEVDAPKKLVQEWKDSEMQEPSTVTFVLKDHNGGTEVAFTQNHIAADRIADLTDGWKQFYVDPLSALFAKK